MNGGIDSFIFSNCGEFAFDTIQALKAIGANQSADWLQRVCDLFPEGQPARSAEERIRQKAAICSDGEHLDDIVQGEIEVDLYQRLLDYWNAADPNAK